jgi:TRAP-type C4-dicarboxylate transport system permease small subunit
VIEAVDGAGLAPDRSPDHSLAARLSRWLDKINRLLLGLSMVALLLTALILTYSVVARYFFRSPTDWQDEAAVFMLVGVTFFCSAHVQSLRGHIGIDALATLLPPAVNALRRVLVDSISMLFCTFFSWKSWTLCYEAWHDGYTTSSTLAPPLWIPYSMMSLGMSLLTVQILVQVLSHLSNKRRVA